MTRSNRYEAAMRRMWTGSAMIVLGVALFVAGLMALRAYLVPIGAVAGAVAGLGVALWKAGFRRQRSMAWRQDDTALRAGRSRPGR